MNSNLKVLSPITNKADMQFLYNKLHEWLTPHNHATSHFNYAPQSCLTLSMIGKVHLLISKGEVSQYNWPPLYFVWIQLLAYDELTTVLLAWSNPNQSSSGLPHGDTSPTYGECSLMKVFLGLQRSSDGNQWRYQWRQKWGRKQH